MLNSSVFKLPDNSFIHLESIYLIGPPKILDNDVGCYIYTKYRDPVFLSRAITKEEVIIGVVSSPYTFGMYYNDNSQRGERISKDYWRERYKYDYPNETRQVSREKYVESDCGELLALTNYTKELEPLIKAWSTYEATTL